MFEPGKKSEENFIEKKKKKKKKIVTMLKLCTDYDKNICYLHGNLHEKRP
jgi:hypothetical protein